MADTRLHSIQPKTNSISSLTVCTRTISILLTTIIYSIYMCVDVSCREGVYFIAKKGEVNLYVSNES